MIEFLITVYALIIFISLGALALIEVNNIVNRHGHGDG
jgi:hypothetical protein